MYVLDATFATKIIQVIIGNDENSYNIIMIMKFYYIVTEKDTNKKRIQRKLKLQSSPV